MKVLYIFPKFAAKNSGGSVVCKRNYDSLCAYYGEDSIISYPIHRKGKKSAIVMFFDDLFSMGFGGLTVEDKKRIVLLIKNEDVGLVFIDSSLFGGLSKYIKKRTSAKTVVFFHNVEYDFVKGLILSNHSFIFSYRIFLALINEKQAARCSDLTITLNQKDSDRLKILYGRSSDYVVPVAIKDKLFEVREKDYSTPLNLLFFGSNFPPNIEAVEILVNNILPYVKANLTVAGSGMDELLKKYDQSDKLRIKGFVNDVDELYSSCDIVVMPIVSGAGMKVKTAEAMLYGKNVIATTNALEGYDVKNVPGIIRCDSINEFINAINNFDTTLPRYNNNIRSLYLDKYSYEASYRSFKKVFDGLR